MKSFVEVSPDSVVPVEVLDLRADLDVLENFQEDEILLQAA